MIKAAWHFLQESPVNVHLPVIQKWEKADVKILVVVLSNENETGELPL